MTKYFVCPQCNKTATADPPPNQMVVAINCRCRDTHGFKIRMQEITQYEYINLRRGKPPAQASQTGWPPTDLRCSNCGKVMQFVFDARMMKCPTCSNYVTEDYWLQLNVSHKPYKCTECGCDTQNSGSIQGYSLCNACETAYIAKVAQMMAAAQAARAVESCDRWYHCTACGDLLPEKGILHQCPESLNPLLTAVEFKYKRGDSMTPVTNVRVWWDPSIQAYRLASPYNKDFVEGLKKQIPYSDRSFDPNTKIWTFVERQLGPIQAFFKLMNIQATIVTRAEAEKASQSTPTGPQRGTAIAEIALSFMRLAGPDAMLKAYRAAALALHPDRGGNMDQMSALNAAWDRIQKEVYNG